MKALLDNQEVVTSEPCPGEKDGADFSIRALKINRKMPKVSLRHAFCEC